MLTPPETVQSDSGCLAKAASFPETILLFEIECLVNDLKQQ